MKNTLALVDLLKQNLILRDYIVIKSNTLWDKNKNTITMDKLEGLIIYLNRSIIFTFSKRLNDIRAHYQDLINNVESLRHHMAAHHGIHMDDAILENLGKFNKESLENIYWK